MNPRPDSQLLLDFAERRSDAAFTELVRRHLNLVNAAAFRITGDPDLAKDVSQAVFIALANQAGKLAGHPVLTGWLHRTTRNIAGQSIRTETRRRARERMSDLMTAASDPDPGWIHIAPQLDAALADLAAADRDAILLRYFENKSAREIADLLGIAPEAAQKRVTRAVERLRGKLDRRGIPTAAGSLAAAIAAYAVPAAPPGLAATISSAVLSGTGTALLTSTPLLVMTTMKKSILATAALLLLGVGIHRLSSSASSSASSEGSSSTTATPLPGKSVPRAEASSPTIKHRPNSGPKADDRRRALADLKRRWLAVGTEISQYPKHFELARESVELLSCSAELHELSRFLIDHEFNSAEIIFNNDLEALFRSPQAGEARELLAEAIASLAPDEQSTKLEEWSNRAAKACPDEEFSAFHASLKNSGCAQEALMGRNFELVKSDPEAAIRNALRATRSGLSSTTSSEHLNYLLGQVGNPENLDYPGLEQLLPPNSGNQDVALSTSTDEARRKLIYTWGRVDPEAAARHVMKHPERMPPRLLETIIEGSNLLEPGQPLRWVSEIPPGPYYDAAAMGVAKHVLHHDEEKTREVVLKMTDMKLREDTLNQLDRELQLAREWQLKREELERAAGREPGSSISPESRIADDDSSLSIPFSRSR